MKLVISLVYIFLSSVFAQHNLLRARELRARTDNTSAKISALGPAVIHSGSPRSGTAGKIWVMPGQERESSYSDPVASAAAGQIHPYLPEMFPNAIPSLKAKAQGRSTSAHIATGPNGTAHLKIKKDGVVNHLNFQGNTENRIVRDSDHPNGVKMTAKVNGPGSVFVASAANPRMIVPESRPLTRSRTVGGSRRRS